MVTILRDKQDNFIKIPKQKLNFYHQIKVEKDIRILIKLVNYLEKWSQKCPNKS